MPRVVAELGPGSSLGTGLAALLAGSSQYIALDLKEHRNPQRDLDILEELCELFRNQTLPDDEPFPPPALKTFPPEIASNLSENLKAERVERIRNDLIVRKGDYVRYIAPWITPACVTSASLDWLFSHAVLEHVDDLADVYASAKIWLRPGGLMSSLIDFSSHRLTSEWNGHWTINKYLWKLIRGKRPYLINRTWRSKHLNMLSKHNLEKLKEITYQRSDGHLRVEFVPEFREMSESDARTQMIFFVARKCSVNDLVKDRITKSNEQ